MKKMVCEICGSKSIFKENGVFVCKECGTEYSAEEAKKLLREVGESAKGMANMKYIVAIKEENQKDKLICNLVIWANYLSKFDDAVDWYYGLHFYNGYEILQADISIIKNSQFPYIEHIESNDFFKKVESSSDDYFNYLYSMWPHLFLSKMEAFLSKMEAHFLELDIDTMNYRYKVFINDSLSSIDPFHDIDRLLMLYNEKKVQIKKCNKIITFFKNYDEYVENDISRSFNAQLSKCYEEIRFFVDDYNKKATFIKEHYDEMKEYYIELLNIKGDIEKQFALPNEFRKFDIVCSLLELLNSGRADDWKEAANLYKTEEYRSKVLTNLNHINSNLMSLQSIVSKFASDMKHEAVIMSSKLIDVSNRMSQINLSLSKIKKDSHYNMIVNTLN